VTGGVTGLPTVPDRADPAAVLDELLAAGHGDGLPVVPPTAARLAAVLAGVADPDAVAGQVPPLFGDLTVRAVGWYAVLAGCRPAELPVVVAACRAALDDDVNLLGLATTTGAPALAVLVHGPVAARLGMTSGAGGLGTGNRANACVGRAVSLALAGIGGARAGLTDMSTLGQSAEYTCCTAEAEESPWPSLAVRRGVGTGPAAGPGGGAVTVHGAAGVVEVLPADGYRDAPAVLGPVAAALAGVALAAGDPGRSGRSAHLLLLPPELAAFLAARGWDPDRIAGSVVAEGTALLRAGASVLAGRGLPAYAAEEPVVAASAADVHVVVTGGAGVKMLLLPGWSGGTRAVTVPVGPL
jgi:hypothetical protein